MILNAKLIITNLNKVILTDAIIAERDAKLAEMVAANKTNGDRIRLSYTSFCRFFVDSAAAQEYIDWYNSTEFEGETTFEIVNL